MLNNRFRWLKSWNQYLNIFFQVYVSFLFKLMQAFSLHMGIRDSPSAKKGIFSL